MLATQLRTELSDLLSWWIDQMMDEKAGGFYGRIDGYGKLDAKADKGIILNTRILWSFSAAAQQTGNPKYRSMADRAYSYLVEHFLDTSEGGVYWLVDFQGNCLDRKKQIYAQAFAIYAFTAYYLLTQKQEALDHAIRLFDLIEEYSFDPKQDGYLEAFDQRWKPLTDLRLSEKDVNEAKTMNTHLHVLEAYTNLYRAYPHQDVQQALRRLILLFIKRFISPQSYHLHLFFTENWELRSQDVSFGHDIECSWLLYEAAEVLGEKDLLKQVENIALKMAEVTLLEGLDTDGSLFNERAANGHWDTDKHWWPQAEAAVGFWNAWQISKDKQYQKAAMDCWNFIQKHLKDQEQGEWHWRVNQQNEVIRSENKAGPWKAPYHNSRFCMELIRRIAENEEN